MLVTPLFYGLAINYITQSSPNQTAQLYSPQLSEPDSSIISPKALRTRQLNYIAQSSPNQTNNESELSCSSFGAVVAVIYGSWIYNYICNQCLSPLMVWVQIPPRARCTTLCDKVCQWLAGGWWFSTDPLVSSTNKSDRHDMAEILLKMT